MRAAFPVWGKNLELGRSEAEKKVEPFPLSHDTRPEEASGATRSQE